MTTTSSGGAGSADPARLVPQPPARALRPAGWLRATHVWLGLLTAVGVVVVSVTGILLNHSGSLGWGSAGPPPVQGTGALEDVAPLHDLLRAALAEADRRGVQVVTDTGHVQPPTGPSDVARAMFRPGTRTAQVRLDDPLFTEVTLDWSTGDVLDVRPRRDARLDGLHTGEAFGQRGIIVSDVVAVALVVLCVGGTAVWLQRLVRRRPRGRSRGWLRANWWFHLVAGLAVVLYTVVLSVTGVILNHKREWGFMAEPARYLGDEVAARARPAALAEVVDWAVDARRRAGDDVRVDGVKFVDYRPLAGYAKVRFDDGETEVVIDVYEPQVFSIAPRRDRWVEDLHSGVRFGEPGRWLSDLTGCTLILLTLNGTYIWLRPAVSSRSRPSA